MSDYIKREDAINGLAETMLYKTHGDNEVAYMLRDLPPADVVEVVRCKDCIHNGSFDTDCPFGWKDKKFNMPSPNDYCSYGEKKDE